MGCKHTIQKSRWIFQPCFAIVTWIPELVAMSLCPILYPRTGAGRYQVGPEMMKGSPLEMAIVPETPLPPEPCPVRGVKLTKSWYIFWGWKIPWNVKIKRSTIAHRNHLTSKKHVNEIGSSTEVMMEKSQPRVQMLVTHVSAFHRSLQRIHRRCLGCSQTDQRRYLVVYTQSALMEQSLAFIQKHGFHGYGQIYTVHIYIHTHTSFGMFYLPVRVITRIITCLIKGIATITGLGNIRRYTSVKTPSSLTPWWAEMIIITRVARSKKVDPLLWVHFMMTSTILTILITR